MQKLTPAQKKLFVTLKPLVESILNEVRDNTKLNEDEMGDLKNIINRLQKITSMYQNIFKKGEITTLEDLDYLKLYLKTLGKDIDLIIDKHHYYGTK